MGEYRKSASRRREHRIRGWFTNAVRALVIPTGQFRWSLVVTTVIVVGVPLAWGLVTGTVSDASTVALFGWLVSAAAVADRFSLRCAQIGARVLVLAAALYAGFLATGHGWLGVVLAGFSGLTVFSIFPKDTLFVAGGLPGESAVGFLLWSLVGLAWGSVVLLSSRRFAARGVTVRQWWGSAWRLSPDRTRAAVAHPMNQFHYPSWGIFSSIALLLMLELTTPLTEVTVLERLINNIIGVAVALVIDLVWTAVVRSRSGSINVVETSIGNER